MWTSVSVSLSDVLEVRGTHLREHEAWALLLQIGQILEGSEENRAITPDTVQLEANGFVYLDFSKHSSSNYTFHREEDGTINFTLSTLAMTIQWCLQYGPKNKCSAKISGDLQSILLHIHNGKTMKNLQYYIEKHHKHSLAIRHDSGKVKDPILNIQKMYQSILGSSCLVNFFPEESTHHKSPANIVILATSQPTVCHERWNVASQSRKDLHGSRDLQEKPANNAQPPSQISDTNVEILQAHHESIWKSSESPIRIEMQHNVPKDKDMLTVVVHFVNGQRAIAEMNGRQTSCGVLLESCVSQLFGPVDNTLFGLAFKKDGEYIFLNKESKLNSALAYFPASRKPNFLLRLKFILRDFQCEKNRKLLHLIYLQTRNDIKQGRILCHDDQALHMAALALQYELGDFQGASQYLLEHFVSSGIVESYSRDNIRNSIDTLHAKLVGMPKDIACELYLCKARELPDFGAHFHSVYRSKKCSPQSSAWLTVSPRGVYLFEIGDSGARRRLNTFMWEHMKKIGYKNNTVTLWTDEGVKMQVYLKSYHKAKYLVGIIGSMHQFYTFEEFRYGRSLHFFSRQNKESSCLPKPDNFHKRIDKRERERPIVRPTQILNKATTSEPDRVEEKNRMNNDSLDVQMTQQNVLKDSCDNDSEENAVYCYAEDNQVSNHSHSQNQTFMHHRGDQNLACVPGSYEVTLEKLHGTFGFSIMGGVDKPTSFIEVQQIVEGGAAEKNGQLQKGDIILGINGLSLFGLTHKKSVEIFSQAPEKSTLIILRPPSPLESVSTFDEEMSSLNQVVPVEEEIQQEVAQKDEDIPPLSALNIIEIEAEIQNDSQHTGFHNIQAPVEFADPVERQDSYNDRVMQVASAFYNQQYTDVESDFQNIYIGSGSEDVAFMVGSDLSNNGDNDEDATENLASREEGDGVSNFSNQDHKLQLADSPRDSSPKSHLHNIPKATTETIDDFVEFKRRLSQIKKANYGSSDSVSTSHN